MVYHDHKRDVLCVLINITPYKAKSGVYLDFRYVNTSKYIRKSASEALSRFEATGNRIEVSKDETPRFATPKSSRRTNSNTRANTATASQIDTTEFVGMAFGIGVDLEHMPVLKKLDKRPIVSERYDNVIYVDFINKCRIL